MGNLDLEALWEALGKLENASFHLHSIINSLESGGANDSLLDSLSELYRGLNKQIDSLRDLLFELDRKNDAD